MYRIHCLNIFLKNGDEMVGVIAGAAGFGIALMSTTGLNALGGAVLEKWVSPDFEQAHFVGIIAGGTIGLIASSPTALVPGYTLGSTITTIFWSTVNGIGLTEESCLLELAGNGAGIATAGIIHFLFPYSISGVIAGSVIGRLIATIGQHKEVIKVDTN